MLYSHTRLGLQLFFYLTYPYQPMGIIKNELLHIGCTLIRRVIVMLKWRHHAEFRRIQDFCEVRKMAILDYIY